MSTITAPTISLEDVQRQGFLVLFDNLNSALAEVEAMRAVQDEALAIHTGREYVPTAIEMIAPDNFIEGHRPSLIGAPVEAYPNVSVMANLATPAPGTDQLDHQEAFSLALFVEVMVKSATSEEEVNRRVQRTAEAVQLVLSRHSTLNETVSGLGTATVEVSDVFTRKERTAYGPHWYWQGARIRYAVRKEASHPSSTGSFLRAADYDIDQT